MDRISALRLFVRLVERGSFSIAARELKIKQSTASKWVAQLEEELGMSLIQRTTRSFHVTEAGRRLQAKARDVLASYDVLTDEFEERTPEPAGQLRLSIPVVFGRRFVVPAVASFLQRHPRVHVELHLNDRYVNLVEEGVDLAIRVGVPLDTSARRRKLAESKRIVVAAPSYLKEHGRPATPRELKMHECLVHGDAHAALIWRFERETGGDLPVQVRGRISANNSEAVLLLARKGLGLALLADWLVEEDLQRGSLVPILEDFSAPPAPIFALTPPGRYPSATARAMTEHLAAALSSSRPVPRDHA